jgi:FkbM family methyltransferase
MGIYDLIRWSRTYVYFYELVNAEHRKFQKNELNFFKEIVPENSLCFDIGANIGDKTCIFLRQKCKIICVEPVKKNIEILQRRYKHSTNAVIIQGAVSDHIGREEVYITEDVLALSTFSKKWLNILNDKNMNRWGTTVKSSFSDIVETTTLDSLIKGFGSPYYIKIDVEGYEVKVIRGLTQKIPLLSFEANLPEFLEETQSCISHLSSIDINAKFNYTSDRFCFENKDWLDFNDFIYFLNNQELRYMEIFCKMPVDVLSPVSDNLQRCSSPGSDLSISPGG